MHVGTRINARREQLEISQDALARAVGISRRKLLVFETGAARASPAELSVIATVLAVPISYLFEG
jgi:transcriptional regulator with XRE-family HTH domain